MLHARYSLAANLCKGKEVLEIACGAGMGLGLLANRASRLVAGDFSETLLRSARRHYRERIAFVRLDAHSLPFADGSFDLILCFEAIYYLRDPRRLVLECHRVLRPEGALLICTANPACSGFNPSPRSHRYFSAEELRVLLVESQFDAAVHGAFPFSANTVRDKMVMPVRSVAARLQLFPRTMKGKEFLKRMFYGRLVRIQEEIHEDSITPDMPPLALQPTDLTKYKVLYAIARR